ncbi:hypothetical protein K439DRAFT_1646813 [Ramaria rubella]|nr:hypothetical protein K439DRAFT_1646813 [Ramaria rubella]
MSLANGNWLGQVPIQLRGLSYTEKLLIVRVRKNYCVVRVESGFFKMCANVALPIHHTELDEVLAFVFTGPTKSTEKELRRTPFLVHSNKVHEALTWLKCNHKDCFDLAISIHNLNSYKDNEIPVTIEYHQSHSNKHAQSTSIHDCEPEEGTAEGECPFVVNGITGNELPIHNTKKLIAIAIEHLQNNGRMLGVGQATLSPSISLVVSIWSWRGGKYEWCCEGP